MAEEKEVKEAQPTEVEAPKPKETKEEVETEKPQAPTNEELGQLRAELQKMEGRWQSAQGVISKQSTEIQTLKDNQDLWKVLIGMQAEQRGISEEEAEQDIQKRKPDFLQQYSVIEQRQKQTRLQEKVNSYQAIVEQELGLKPGDEDYDTIQAFVTAGNWNRADKKIEALKTQKTEQPKSEKGEKVETEKERIDRLADERLKEKMIEKGLLTPEGGEPSAASPKGFAKIEQDYADGLISTAEYKKAMQAHGKR